MSLLVCSTTPRSLRSWTGLFLLGLWRAVVAHPIRGSTRNVGRWNVKFDDWSLLPVGPTRLMQSLPLGPPNRATELCFAGRETRSRSTKLTPSARLRDNWWNTTVFQRSALLIRRPFINISTPGWPTCVQWRQTLHHRRSHHHLRAACLLSSGYLLSQTSLPLFVLYLTSGAPATQSQRVCWRAVLTSCRRSSCRCSTDLCWLARCRPYLR